MKKITAYEVIDHGIDNAQYFQGCGTAFTEFEDVATGIGASAAEALEDACESLAQADWDTSTIIDELSEEADIPEDADEVWHYVSIRVR